MNDFGSDGSWCVSRNDLEFVPSPDHVFEGILAGPHRVLTMRRRNADHECCVVRPVEIIEDRTKRVEKRLRYAVKPKPETVICKFHGSLKASGRVAKRDGLALGRAAQRLNRHGVFRKRDAF